jgi:hypothetical protein
VDTAEARPLSGLTTAELGIVKQRIEARANPEIAEFKAETTRALADAEVAEARSARSASAPVWESPSPELRSEPSHPLARMLSDRRAARPRHQRQRGSKKERRGQCPPLFATHARVLAPGAAQRARQRRAAG